MGDATGSHSVFPISAIGREVKSFPFSEENDGKTIQFDLQVFLCSKAIKTVTNPFARERCMNCVSSPKQRD